MESLYDCTAGRDRFAAPELLTALADYTEQIGREISVYIDRSGAIRDVSIGDADSAELPAMRLLRNERRLAGVRCLHTHPNGNPHLSEPDLGALERGKLDAMAALGVRDGLPTGLCCAVLTGASEGGRLAHRLFGPVPVYAIDHAVWLEAIAEADGALRGDAVEVVESGRERAFLVGVETGNERYDSLQELAELADTAGADVVGRESQRRNTPDNAFYIGRGKAEELVKVATAQNVGLFIFDDELSAVQIRNLEQLLGARVIDRTALILDIFAGRATSREGKLQVELAQLKYRLPRLIGQGQTLSRLGGGIGTRGPGEKKLETDRRRIRRQIYELECEIDKMAKQRALRRTRREKNDESVVALVGYTNAGKSTLLNALSGSDVLAEDKLFATLDPVTRQVALPNSGQALFTDTVGFIDKLPHDLVKAFRSTLEETLEADIILHVIDAASPNAIEQARVVETVLDELGVKDSPIIKVYNKSDALGGEAELHEAGSLTISALTGEGLTELLERVERELDDGRREATFAIPYHRGDVAAYLRRAARILDEAHEEQGWALRVSADAATLGAATKMLGENA